MRNDNRSFVPSEFRVTPPPIPEAARLTPPPIPKEARWEGRHARRDDEVLFDEPSGEDASLKKTLSMHDKIMKEEKLGQLISEPSEDQVLAEHGKTARAVEIGEQKILQVIQTISLPVEIRMQIIQDPEIKAILKHYDQSPNDQEALQIIRQVADNQAFQERLALERMGLRFDAENTLILDQNGQEAQSYSNIKRRLEKLNQLTEVAYAQPKSAQKKIEHPPVAPSKETITDHVYDDLLTLGIDTTTVGNALSAELLTELEDANYVAGKTSNLLGAIDKTIRAFENRGNFTLDLYGDPQPIGFFKKIQNRLFGGRVSDKQKSSREYRNILALQALRDAINSNGPVAAIKHPTAESFAPIDRVAPQRSPLSSRPLRLAGAAGVAAGVAAGGYGYDRSQPQTEFDEVATTAPAQAKEVSAKNTRVADEIKISPRFSDDEVTPRPRRASVADYTAAARSAEAESSLERTPWETASPVKKETNQKLTRAREIAKNAVKKNQPGRRTTNRIDVFADNHSVPDAAKAPEFVTPEEEITNTIAPEILQSPRERAPKMKSLESHKPKLETAKPTVENFSDRIAKAKKVAAEIRARQTKAKSTAATIGESLIPNKATKKETTRELKTSNNLDSTSNLKITPDRKPVSEVVFSSSAKKVESALNTRFGADAERYLNALPNDVKSALAELSPTQARALLADKIINIHNDPKISADRITALHVAKEALKDI